VTQENPAIHVALRFDPDSGKRFLIVASDSRKAESAMISIHDIGDAEARWLGAEAERSSKLKFSSGKGTIDLPPLGVAIYEVPRAPKLGV